MLFTSLLGRPQRGGQRTPATGLRRPGQCRPRLEILEERLPPGDTVLGALLFGPFAGPGFDDWDSIALLPESSPSAGPPAKHRPFDLEVASALEDERSTFSPTFAPSPTPSEQPSRAGSTPRGSVPAGDAEPGWDVLSPGFPADDSFRLI